MIVFISTKHPKLMVLDGAVCGFLSPKGHLVTWDILAYPNVGVGGKMLLALVGRS